MKKDILADLFGKFGMSSKETLTLKKSDRIIIVGEKLSDYGTSGKKQALIDVSVNGGKQETYSLSAILEAICNSGNESLDFKAGYVPSIAVRKTFQRIYYKATK